MNYLTKTFEAVRSIYNNSMDRPKTILAVSLIIAGSYFMLPKYFREPIKIGDCSKIKSLAEIEIDQELEKRFKDVPIHVRDYFKKGRFVFQNGAIYEKGGRKEGEWHVFTPAEEDGYELQQTATIDFPEATLIDQIKIKVENTIDRIVNQE